MERRKSLAKLVVLFGIVLLPLFPGWAAAQQPDTTPHKILYVQTSDGVRLEVVDWGGSGSPLIFLAGFGNTAHSFDSFAPHFNSNHHVYGITRRGFGASAKPSLTLENYDPDRLGDDVLEVMAALKLVRPIIIGHSIAGQELSSIGSRQPDRVNGLVYLDAAMLFAFHNPEAPDPFGDAAEAIRDLKGLRVLDQQSAIAASERLKVSLSKLQNWIGGYQQILREAPRPYWAMTKRTDWPIQNAMILAQRHYNRIPVPFLAISAIPCGGTCEDGKSARRQADYVGTTNPKDRVVQLLDADHNIWLSNGPDVEREINSFLLERTKR